MKTALRLVGMTPFYTIEGDAAILFLGVDVLWLSCSTNYCKITLDERPGTIRRDAYDGYRLYGERQDNPNYGELVWPAEEDLTEVQP